MLGGKNLSLNETNFLFSKRHPVRILDHMYLHVHKCTPGIYIYKYTWRSFVSPWSLARALRVGREVKRSSLLLLLLSTFLLLPPLSLRSREGIVCTLYPLLSFRSPFSLPEATLLSRFSLGSPCLARPIHAPRDLATPPTEPQIAFIPWIDWQYTYVSRVDRTVMETVTSSSSLFFPLLFRFFFPLLFLFFFFFFRRFHPTTTRCFDDRRFDVIVFFSISLRKIACKILLPCFCSFFFASRNLRRDSINDSSFPPRIPSMNLL